MKASLTELRVFVALAESGHFTRAAEKLGMSQSSLSAALVKLEKQLGTRLFDRHTRACRVNEAGAALVPAARRLVADWDHLFADARDFARFSRGSVTVAAPNAQCALVLPPVIRVFRDTHPGVRVVLHDVPEHEVHALVRSGAADLGIATQTDGRSDLVSTAMSADEFIVVLPPGQGTPRHATNADVHLIIVRGSLSLLLAEQDESGVPETLLAADDAHLVGGAGDARHQAGGQATGNSRPPRRSDPVLSFGIHRGRPPSGTAELQARLRSPSCIPRLASARRSPQISAT